MTGKTRFAINDHGTTAADPGPADKIEFQRRIMISANII